MRVIFRLNEDKDKDIIEYLSNCKNVSKGVKYAIRKGVLVNPSVKVAPIVLDEIVQEVVPVMKEVDDDEVISNILGTASMFEM